MPANYWHRRGADAYSCFVHCKSSTNLLSCSVKQLFRARRCFFPICFFFLESISPRPDLFVSITTLKCHNNYSFLCSKLAHPSISQNFEIDWPFFPLTEIDSNAVLGARWEMKSLLIWSHCLVWRAVSLRSVAETWIFEQLSVVKCYFSVQSLCNGIILLLFFCHTFGPSATQAPFQATLHFKHNLDLIFTPQPLQMPMLIQSGHWKTCALHTFKVLEKLQQRAAQKKIQCCNFL